MTSCEAQRSRPCNDYKGKRSAWRGEHDIARIRRNLQAVTDDEKIFSKNVD
jgi:hypothetical protein